VVDLQSEPSFRDLGVQLLSLSPDSLEAWATEGERVGIRTPMLSDQDNKVATAYGVMRWAMPTGEPGHTFVLVDPEGRIVWIRDYGAPENGGAMYVPPEEVVQLVREALSP